jgi:hemerythrin superfamily protein
VKEALERHASAEEDILYPRVPKDVPDGTEEVKDALEEHDQIRESLKEVEEHEAGTELFTLAVAQLVATTKHHVGVEEAELLPDFRKNSEASEREELGRRFNEAKTKTAARSRR